MRILTTQQRHLRLDPLESIPIVNFFALCNQQQWPPSTSTSLGFLRPACAKVAKGSAQLGKHFIHPILGTCLKIGIYAIRNTLAASTHEKKP